MDSGVQFGSLPFLYAVLPLDIEDQVLAWMLGNRSLMAAQEMDGSDNVAEELGVSGEVLCNWITAVCSTLGFGV